jgi:hypothetical protein
MPALICDDVIPYNSRWYRGTGAPRPVLDASKPFPWHEKQMGMWLFGRDPRSKREILEACITARSVSDDWGAVVKEWDIKGSHAYADPRTRQKSGRCLCTHGIQEHVHIYNGSTDWLSVVGNCCIEEFMGLKSKAISHGLAKMREDPTKPMPKAVIDFAEQRGWLSALQSKQCRSNLLNRRKKNLSPIELLDQERFNHLVLRYHDRDMVGARTEASRAAYSDFTSRSESLLEAEAKARKAAAEAAAIEQAIRADPVRRGMRDIQGCPEMATSPAVINYATQRCWLKPHEMQFLQDITGRNYTSLSLKQREWRRDLNLKIVRLHNAAGRCADAETVAEIIGLRLLDDYAAAARQKAVGESLCTA